MIDIKLIEELRHLVWRKDIPSPTTPEYKEHHRDIQEILCFIDTKILVEPAEPKTPPIYGTDGYDVSMDKIRDLFPQAFINMRNELILDRDSNLYFRLEDVENDLDFKCKMIAWLSRPIYKGMGSQRDRLDLLFKFNAFFETDFTMNDIETIYSHLGNDINRSKCETFIKFNFDMHLFVD